MMNLPFLLKPFIAIFAAVQVTITTASPPPGHATRWSPLALVNGDAKASQYATGGGVMHIDPATNIGTLKLNGLKPSDAGLSIWNINGSEVATAETRDVLDNHVTTRILESQSQYAVLTGWPKPDIANATTVDVGDSFFITLELLEGLVDDTGESMQYKVRLGGTVLGTSANGNVTTGLINTASNTFEFNIPTVLIMDLLDTNNTSALGNFERYSSLRYHEEEETHVLSSLYKKMTLRASGELVEPQGLRTCLLLILGGPIGWATCFFETLFGCIIGPITLFTLCLWI